MPLRMQAMCGILKRGSVQPLGQAKTRQAETQQGETPQGETPQGKTPQGETPQGEIPQRETPQRPLQKWRLRSNTHRFLSKQ